MASGDPRYTDEESALILHRAAELQAQEGRSLSLPELESAAAEAGIDVALVRRAATELSTMPKPAPPPVPSSGGALGAPLMLAHERVVPGPVSPDTWDEVRHEIQRQLGIDGDPEQLGRQFVWSARRGRKLRVSLAPRGGGTLVRVEERMSELAGGLFLGMALPVALAGLGFILPICIAVLGMPALIPVALGVWFAMAFMLARTIYRSIGTRRDAELRRLADGIEEVCQAPRALPPADGTP